jgi:hypothetical protein
VSATRVDADVPRSRGIRGRGAPPARRQPAIARPRSARAAELRPTRGRDLRTRQSDHAATYAKYLFETRLGVLTASAAPSVSSVTRRQDLADCLFLAISQSGRSPDLLVTTRAAREAGAFVVALVNAEGSPLAEIADETLPLWAGEETSVAATKSYITALAAVAQLAAEWSDDAKLQAALTQAPSQLSMAWNLDWSLAQAMLVRATNLFVIARGVVRGRAGSRAQVQGDVRAARRGVQRRRGAPRSAGAARERLSGIGPVAGRRGARRTRGARGLSRRAAWKSPRPERVRAARSSCRRCRRTR